MHGENIFFLLLVGAVYLISWLVRNGRAFLSDQSDNEPDYPPPRAPAQSEEERVRRFMEALGQPASHAPPRKITARPAQGGALVPPRPPIVARELRRDPARKRNFIPRPKRASVFLPGLPVPPALKEIVTRSAPATIEVPQQVAFELRPPSVQAPSDPPRSRTVPVAELYRKATAPPPAPAPRTDLLALLRSPGGVRQAVLLHEILGPPCSLREMNGERF